MIAWYCDREGCDTRGACRDFLIVTEHFGRRVPGTVEYHLCSLNCLARWAAAGAVHE